MCAMNKAQIKNALKAIGKRCFVNCFEVAWQKGGKLSRDDIKENDPQVGEDVNGLDTRRSNIHRIFKAKQQCYALKKCFTVQGNLEAEKRARLLHRCYCQLQPSTGNPEVSSSGSYLTVKIGIISTTIPVLLLWMGAALWLSLAAQWLLGFALWHYVWDYVYPPKSDAKTRKLSLKKPHSLFLIHVVATVMTPYLPLLVAARYGLELTPS